MKTLLAILATVALALPAAAACPSDQALLGQKDAPEIVEFLISHYRQTFSNEAGNMSEGTTVPALLSFIENDADVSCSHNAVKRHLTTMLKLTSQRHMSDQVTMLWYHNGRHSTKAIRYTVAITVFREGEDEPFATDFYRWNGNRFALIKTETYDS